jgi:hypothetical protein
MKKIYVKWGFTDDYGRAYPEDAHFDWFETQEQADAFIEKKKQGNGGYFKLWKVAEGDFAKYQLMNELVAEVAKLKKEFE